jgi:copper homeostasis protein CutC
LQVAVVAVVQIVIRDQHVAEQAVGLVARTVQQTTVTTGVTVEHKLLAVLVMVVLAAQCLDLTVTCHMALEAVVAGTVVVQAITLNL